MKLFSEEHIRLAGARGEISKIDIEHLITILNELGALNDKCDHNFKRLGGMHGCWSRCDKCFRVIPSGYRL